MNDGEQEDPSSNLEIVPDQTAFFFDFDGVLADIVESPDAVSVSAAALEALDNLHRLSGGALAVISGRPIASIDRFLAPLQLPASGIHGLERRGADGRLHSGAYDKAVLERLNEEVSAFAQHHDGMIVEQKPGSVALHYRQRPDMYNSTLQFGCKVAAKHPGVAFMRGKMVIELRLGGRTKGDAVSDFMAAKPFAGRHPVFVGDDVTDEDAFRFVEDNGGTGIKVGDGETAASLRAADRETFERWLCAIAAVRTADVAISRVEDEPTALRPPQGNAVPLADVADTPAPGA